MRNDQGKGFFVSRAYVDEVNVQSIDVGDELGKSIQLCLRPSPIIIRRPIACEALHRRKGYPLRSIRDRLLLWPPCCRDAAAQFLDRLLRYINRWVLVDQSVRTPLIAARALLGGATTGDEKRAGTHKAPPIMLALLLGSVSMKYESA